MSKAVMSSEWIDNVPQNYPDVDEDTLPLLRKVWKRYESAVTAANALVGGKDAVRAAAMELFRNSGSPAVAKLDALAEKIAKVTAELATMQDTYNSAVDAATVEYTEQAEQNAAQSGSGVAEEYSAAKAKFTQALKLVFGVDTLGDIENLPTIPQRKSGGSSEGKGSGEGWSPRLASATVNGENVAPSDGKTYPSLENVKDAIGISGPTRSFSATLLSRNGGVRELSTDANKPTTISIEFNGKQFSIVLIPRPKKAKADAESK